LSYVSGDVREQLAYVGHDVVQAGLVVGSGGNLSARTDSDPDTCWVTGAGTWLDRLNRPAFVRVRISDGTTVSPGEPTTELALHLATYRARPDVAAVVHLHPQTLLLLDAIGEPVRLVTTDHVYYLRRVVTAPFALPGSVELASIAAALVADGTNCVVLSHHGCSVLADSVELAHKRARYLEEAALLTYRAMLLPDRHRLRECPAEFLDHIEGGTSVNV
jgi:ribulose-5-phosphate 4-epimerase/fuculose-1-phosphate aldolase